MALRAIVGPTGAGKTESLLWIDHWNARWERTYTFSRPIQVPKQSRLETRFVFAQTSQGASPEANLLSALLTPVNPAEYDELTLAIQKHQIEIAIPARFRTLKR